jgi:uncharacterized protein YxeA
MANVLMLPQSNKYHHKKEKMKKLWILAIVALFSACSADMIPQTQVPDRAKTNLMAQHPEAKNAEWSKMRKDMTTTYTATFKDKSGKKMKVKFNEQGEIIGQ